MFVILLTLSLFFEIIIKDFWTPEKAELFLSADEKETFQYIEMSLKYYICCFSYTSGELCTFRFFPLKVSL